MQEENINQQICLSDDKDKNTQVFLNEYDFSKFTSDGFDLDDELINKFYPVAKKLNLSQESVEMLMEIALEMSKKQRDIYEKDEKIKYEESLAKYNQMFKDDSELPKLNSPEVKKYMSLANFAYNAFCSSKLKELFISTGLNYHPELIKMFHTIGELAKEDGINYGGKPVVEELTPAQILYGPRA